MSDFSHLSRLHVEATDTVDYTFYQIEGEPTLQVAPATEANKPYFNAILRRGRKNVRALNAGNNASGGNAKRSRSGKVGKYSVAAVAEIASKVRNRKDFIAPLVKDGKIADLKASLATVDEFTRWLAESIAAAEKVTPTTISKPANKPANKPASKPASQPASSRGN